MRGTMTTDDIAKHQRQKNTKCTYYNMEQPAFIVAFMQTSKFCYRDKFDRNNVKFTFQKKKKKKIAHGYIQWYTKVENICILFSRVFLLQFFFLIDG